MANSYHGMSSDDILLDVPHFPSVKAAPVQSAVPVSAGAMTTLDPKFGLLRWQNSWTYRVFTTEEKYAIVDFWLEHNGGVDGFWLPSWIRDFTASAGVTSGDTYIDVEDTDFVSYFDSVSSMISDYTDQTDPPVNQWGVMIMEKDRSMHFRGIESVETNRINFWDSAGAGMPGNIALGDIVLISLVRYVRFRSGEMDITWLADNSKVDITVAFTELFFEGVLA